MTTLIEHNGIMFPVYEGVALSWSAGLYYTHSEEEKGFPRARCVIAALRANRPEQFARERRDLLKDSFGKMFGHNAQKLLALYDAYQERPR